LSLSLLDWHVERGEEYYYASTLSDFSLMFTRLLKSDPETMPDALGDIENLNLSPFYLSRKTVQVKFNIRTI